EKQIEVPLFVYDPFRKKNNEISQLTLQFRILPDAVERGVCFKNMKVCVHGLFLIGVLLAQAKVIKQVPLGIKRFEVAIKLLIVTEAFNEVKQFLRFCKRFLF